MTQQTQRYKRTLKGSIGAGVQSVLGSDRRFTSWSIRFPPSIIRLAKINRLLLTR